MTTDTIPADLDIEYLHREAKQPISEIDEIIFVELVGRNHSDGMPDDEALGEALKCFLAQ